jgi:hypothetical protein
MILRTLAIWIGLLVLAILNGGFREAVLVPRLGRGVGHAVSTVMLSALILGAGWISTPWIGPRSVQEAWTIGLIWVSLTLAFEFLAGHFVFGKPWVELFADYNLLAGRIWIMVLVVTLMTPIVAFTRRAL